MTQHIEEARKLVPEWRYEIQYGPEGEANYAWIYKGDLFVAAMRTHHAAEIVKAIAALAAAEERGRIEERESSKDGNRSLPFDRDTLGRFVREAWVRWALTQPSPKPSWLVPYDELDELDKEADRQIGEAVARWTLIGDSAAITKEPTP